MPISHYAFHYLHYSYVCMTNCLHVMKRISTSKTCHVHLHSKANYLYAHLQGEPFATYEDNAFILNSHIFLSPLKTSTGLSSITKKGEIVRASSATPSWFWSIDDKLG